MTVLVDNVDGVLLGRLLVSHFCVLNMTVSFYVSCFVLCTITCLVGGCVLGACIPRDVHFVGPFLLLLLLVTICRCMFNKRVGL